MVRIKNALAGILHITAAGLRLEGFESKDVDDDTPELERRTGEGLIELVTGENDPEPEEQPAAPDNTPAAETPQPVETPSDFDTLDETDAIEYIEVENDPGVIQSMLREEERPGVIDALKARLQEIEDAGK